MISFAEGRILSDEMFEVGTIEMLEASEFGGEKPVPFEFGDERMYIMLYEESDKFYIGTMRMCMNTRVEQPSKIYALEIIGGEIALINRVRFPQCSCCHMFVHNIEMSYCGNCYVESSSNWFRDNYKLYGDVKLIYYLDVETNVEREFWYNIRTKRNLRKRVMSGVRRSVKLAE